MSGEAPEPFRIGLRPIEAADWLRPDDRLPAYLAEKARLTALDCDAVFASVDGMEESQAEAEAMVADWLATHSPSRDDAGGRAARRDRDVTAPLLRAAMRVCEDLVLMRRAPGGWRLAAAALHFPSAWRLAEKIGRPLQTVHAPVPGFGAGTRQASLIDRMFDNLRPGTIVERGNWSLHAEPDLHLPRSGSRVRETGGETALYRRAERQTLRKLPGSGDVLFTIDVTVTPIDDVPERERRTIAEQLRRLGPAERDYKGVGERTDAVARRLEATSAAAR